MQVTSLHEYYIRYCFSYQVPEYLSRNKRETEIIWTKEKATEFCNNFIKKSQTYNACNEVPSVSADFPIESCILDIEVSPILQRNQAWETPTLGLLHVYGPEAYAQDKKVGYFAPGNLCVE